MAVVGWHLFETETLTKLRLKKVGGRMLTCRALIVVT